MTLFNKVVISLGLILTISLGFVGFTFVQIGTVQDKFSGYREVARESLVLSNLSEDLADARIAVLKFRATGSEDAAQDVSSNIAEIVDAEPMIREIVTYGDHLARLEALGLEAQRYGQIFSEAQALQQRRNALVDSLDTTGTETRKTISDIITTAYTANDNAASYQGALVQQHFMLARYYGEKFLLVNDEKHLERVGYELDRVRESMAVMEREVLDSSINSLRSLLSRGVEKYSLNLDQVANIIRERNALYFDGLDVIGPRLLDGYDELFEEVEAKQNELGPATVSGLESIAERSMILGLFIISFIAVVAASLGLTIRRNFRHSILQIDRLASGELAAEVTGADRRDEFGHIARAMDVFRSNGLKVKQLEKEQADAEEAARKDRKRAMHELADSFEEKVGGMITTVQEAAGNLQTVSATISTSVDDTNKQSVEVANSSQQASMNVQTVAVASEELDASITEISRNVGETSSLTRSCVDAAALAEKQMNDLKLSVESIQSVVKSINEVAEQTNLLALNATIEAARAGDAGKGFAVVAAEVKSLANQTHGMTDEVTRNIREIESNTLHTVEIVSDIILKIEEVDQRATTVAGAVEQQSASTREIAENAQQVASGTEQVTNSIIGVQKAAEVTAQSTSHMTTAADNLTEQALALQTAVGTFMAEVKR